MLCKNGGQCHAKPAKNPPIKTLMDERWYSSLQRLVSVRSKAGVIITHAPSTSDACEMHTQSIEESIAGPVLRVLTDRYFRCQEEILPIPLIYPPLLIRFGVYLKWAWCSLTGATRPAWPATPRFSASLGFTVHPHPITSVVEAYLWKCASKVVANASTIIFVRPPPHGVCQAQLYESGVLTTKRCLRTLKSFFCLISQLLTSLPSLHCASPD
jgi:hypothetical protein